MSVEIGYFDSSGQARREITIRRDKETSGVKRVPGMGPGAYTFTFAGITSLTVARGPYTLTVSGTMSASGDRPGGSVKLF